MYQVKRFTNWGKDDQGDVLALTVYLNQQGREGVSLVRVIPIVDPGPPSAVELLVITHRPFKS
jgi:hypothetical protein